MDDFNVDEGERVLDIMDGLHRVFYTKPIDLTFELKVQCDAYNGQRKRLKIGKEEPVQEEDSVQNTATSNQMSKLRPGKLQEQQAIRLEVIERSGTHQHQLMQ